MSDKVFSVSFNTPVPDIGSACWYYCCELPRRTLEANGWIATANRPYNCDVAVFSRAKDFATIRLVESLKLRGTKIVYDLDDNVWQVDKENPYSKDITQEVLNGVDKMIGIVDLVTVTTCELADVIKERFNKPVEILPNCFDPIDLDAGFPQCKELRDVDPARPIIFVSGSLSHKGDFCDIKAIAAKNPLGGKAIWVAMVPKELWSMFLDGSVLTPVATFADYVATLKMLGSLPNVLGMVPLADTVFNRSKSRLKWAEYSFAGIPAVYSGVNEYRSFASVWTAGGATVDDWVLALKDGWESRERMREEQLLLARGSCDIKKWWPLWADVYSKI